MTILRLMDRKSLYTVSKEMAEILQIEIPVLKCTDCEYFDHGKCAFWGQDIPFSSWKNGCNKYELYVPF